RLRVGWVDGWNLIPSSPLSAGYHPARGLALPALYAQLSRRGGPSRRAWARHLLRNCPQLGAEVRTGDRAPAAASPSSREQPMAPGRDGGPDCRRANVPLACRRPRGRGPRHAGSAPARHPGGTSSDAQAAQEARLRPEVAGDRQAALVRRSVPASTTELPARTGAPGEQSGREFASGSATTRAQNAAVQISSIRPVLSQHACRRRQYLQPSAPSRLTINAADLPSRGGERMAECSCRSVNAHSA